MRNLNKRWVPREFVPSQLKTRVEYTTRNLRAYNEQEIRLEHTVSVYEA